MQSTTSSNPSIKDHRLADFPALASLRITDNDLEELSTQGFVCEERRGDRRYFKLRFRRNGKQVVRYVGNADRAAAVESELSELQYEATVMRDLKARAKIARRMLREAKMLIEPTLEANGFAFHGLAIRQPRKRSADVSTSNTKI